MVFEKDGRMGEVVLTDLFPGGQLNILLGDIMVGGPSRRVLGVYQYKIVCCQLNTLEGREGGRNCEECPDD